MNYRDKNFAESKKVRMQLIAITVIVINRVISMVFGGVIDAPDEIVLPIAELVVDGLVTLAVTVYTIAQGWIDKTLAGKR